MADAVNPDHEQLVKSIEAAAEEVAAKHDAAMAQALSPDHMARLQAVAAKLDTLGKS